MGEVTNFAEYRRKKKRKKALRFTVSVLLIFGIIYGISLLLYESGAEDVEGAFDAMFNSSGSESRFPIHSPGGDIKEIFSLGGTISVLNDTNVFFYSSGGEMTGSIQHHYQTPTVRSAKSSFLLYDQGNKQYALYDKDELIRSCQTDECIFLGDISVDGEYAIASTGNCLTEVTFYNEDGEEQFVWESNDKLAMSLCLDDDGDYMVVGCANTKGGKLVSTLVILDTEEMDTRASVEMENELILDVMPHGTGFLVITDEQVFKCSNKGVVLSSCSFEGQQICGFDVSKNNIALLLGNFRHDRSYTLVSLNGNLKELGRTVIDEKVTDIQCDEYGIYMLMGNMLNVYDENAVHRDGTKFQNIQNMYPMGHYLMVAANDRIHKLDFT